MLSTPSPYPSVSTGAPLPDDAEIDRSQPSVCVDYLSHKWTDEDVWQSWKAMTKKKNEIANGVRLENASWRTWAKQRGNLATVSPETLNWLKDSDVTWLYGPLHEHAEPVPPPKVASVSERFGLDAGTSAPLTGGTPELAPFSSQHHSISSDGLTPEAYPPARRQSGYYVRRDNAAFAHAGFGSYVNRSGKKSILKQRTLGDLLAPEPNGHGHGHASSHDHSHAHLKEEGQEDEKEEKEGPRHITFNSKVEQCIALDEPMAEPSEEEGEQDHATIAKLAPTHLKAQAEPQPQDDFSYDNYGSFDSYAGPEWEAVGDAPEYYTPDDYEPAPGETVTTDTNDAEERGRAPSRSLNAPSEDRQPARG